MLVLLCSSFIAAIILLAIYFQYLYSNKALSFLDPNILFQLYFFIQLPLVLFLGINYELPGFLSLSPKIPFDKFILLSAIICLAYFAFIAGSHVIGKKFIRMPIFGNERFNKSTANFVSLLTFIFGYISFIYLLQVNGGYDNFMLERESWRAGGMSGQGWIIFPSTTMLAIASLCIVIVNKNIFCARRGGFLFVLLVCLTVAPATQLGFRGMMLWPVLQLLVAYHLRITRLPFRDLVIGLIIIIGLFTIYGIYREITFIATTGIDISIALDFIQNRPEFIFSTFLRSKGADIVSVIVSNINNLEDFKFFWPLAIEALTIPIPSDLWSGKPIPQSVEFAQIFFGLGGGVSPTIVGEAYWQAGILGVLIILFFTGMIIKIYVNTMLIFINHDAVALLMLSIFPLMILIAESLQGFLNSFVLSYISCSLFLILIALFNQFFWLMRKFKS